MSKYDNASLVQIPSGYKAGTLYSVLPANGDGDFDFTRASIATRVNAEGLIETVASGVPRLDYPILNGVVQSCPALLLEPARTNLALRSEEFNNGAWTKTNATITTNDAMSPDGNTTAEKITDNATNGHHRVSQGVSVTSGTSYTASVFVKDVDKGYFSLNFTTAGFAGVQIYFDLTNGTVVSGTGIIENYGNGWYRLSATQVANSTTTGTIGFHLSISNNVNYVGTGQSAYIWGAQIEAGSYATSYIPTAGSTVARAAEVCNGAGTSAEFNDSEGVLFAEISALADAELDRRLAISDGTTSNRIFFYYPNAASFVGAVIVDGGVTQASINATNINQVDNNKFAIKYKANDVSFWVNGFEIGVDTSAAMPSGISELAFDDGGGSNPFYGKTKQAIAFDAALTDEQLEDLTSWDSFEELAASQFYTLY